MPIAEFAKYPNVKTVNINATIPIVNVTPPLYGYREGIKMTISDILKCLMRRAIIHEVMPDGTTIRLDLKNFRDDNRAAMKVEKKEEIVEEEPKTEEAAPQELSQNTEEQPAVFVTGMSLEGDVPVEDQPAVLTTTASTSDEEVVIEAEHSEPVKVEEATTTVTTTKSTSKKSSKKKKK